MVLWHFFCHGYSTGFQLGVTRCNTPRGRPKLERFAEAVREISTEDLTLTLYACSTADNDNGEGSGTNSFASLLEIELFRRGLNSCHVDGHIKPGSALRSPYVRRFGNDGSTHLYSDGQEIVPEGHELWNTWRQRIGSRRSRGSSEDSLKYTYPLLTIEQIHASLQET